MIKKIVNTRYYDDKAGFSFIFDPVEDSIITKKTKDGFEIKYITPDSDYEGPDSWGDDGLFLVNYHRDFDVRRDKIITKEDVISFYHGEKIPQLKDYFILPLSMLSHSGVWLSLAGSFSCDSGGWDTSHVGVILVSKKESKDEAAARQMAAGLIEEWNQSLSGDVYCIVKEVYNKKKEQLNYDVVGGFYGHKYAIEALKTDI